MSVAKLQHLPAQFLLAEKNGSDCSERPRELAGLNLILRQIPERLSVIMEKSLAKPPLRILPRIVIDVEKVIADGVSMQCIQYSVNAGAANHRIQTVGRLEAKLGFAALLAGTTAFPDNPMIKADVLVHSNPTFTRPRAGVLQ
jgi:hypothetical protein